MVGTSVMVLVLELPLYFVVSMVVAEGRRRAMDASRLPQEVAF